ncbi:hypothetical protein [Agromyces aerolatus]|uniref:hypothetical protein n=1 Tax=Agromyces sp. LY-1074 TaxID=3074080 RepID=UPI00285B0931|nr:MULTISPECIES: hypothetical protein [unclassified Agromyces]MDR5701478.1 hypothetical protein [Agromyces sp. LY-1074]MDR5704455.1 hypothetical protein [Agromyces sp. LY-1358]
MLSEPAMGVVLLVNPLGAALRHYCKVLGEALRTQGLEVEEVSVLEPSASGAGRLRWAIDYIRMLWCAVRKHRCSEVVVLWPVFGMFDLLILRLMRFGATSLIVHDPIPMVRSVGYGRFAWKLAGSAGRATVLVHSEAAFRDVQESSSGQIRVAMLPHPVSVGRPDTADRPARPAGLVVRVLGQYKPTRDIEALEQIASDLAGDARLEIVGRGWPDLVGWHVDSRFVPENELNELICSSSVVVIPYRRFYQSGIALRCLELEVPFVGESGTSLRSLLPADTGLLVRDGEWRAAIDAAAAMSDAELRDFRERYLEDAHAAYATYFGRRASNRAKV